MYMLKLTHGDVDEPEPWTTEILGIYESLDEACEATESKFGAIMDRLGDDCDDCDRLCYDNIERSGCDCYVSYGYYDCELGCVLREYYYRVYVVEG